MRFNIPAFLLAAAIITGGAGSASAAVSASRCEPGRLSLIINRPLPHAVFFSGDEIVIEGRVWYPGSLIDSGRCGKLVFFLAPDSDLEFADCSGRLNAPCNTAAVCAPPPECGAVSRADTRSIIADQTGQVIKIGELAVDDSLGAVNSGDYAAEFRKMIKLPETEVFSGPVRIYVQFTGSVSGIANPASYEWVIAYQKITIGKKSEKNLNSFVKAGSVFQADYCRSTSGPAAILSWVFEGGGQTAYQVQISDHKDFSNILHDSGKITSQTMNYATPSGKFSWGKRYYWRVKAWDLRFAESDWSIGNAFDAPLHPYPEIMFDWLPKVPAAGGEITFIDQSKTYGQSGATRWSWKFPGGSPEASQANEQVTTFNNEGEKTVELSVTDSEGYTCSASHTIQIVPSQSSLIK